jgi:MFS family permease
MLLPTIGDALRSHHNRATSALEARRMGTDDMATGQSFRVIDLLRHGTEPPPLAAVTGRPWWPWLVVAITCIGAFIGQLDASIVQLALPTLVDVFHDSLARVTWVALAYSLAFAASLPIFGRLCEIYGRKVLYLAGFFFFTIATALCGFAADLGSLILFRILQGIAGSLLGANSISVLVATAGPTRRARAMGIFSAAQAVGLCLGPVIGGILVGTLGWRSIFLATVPFGAIAVVLGWLALPRMAGLAADRSCFPPDDIRLDRRTAAHPGSRRAGVCTQSRGSVRLGFTADTWLCHLFRRFDGIAHSMGAFHRLPTG